jgi:hypothetical protein
VDQCDIEVLKRMNAELTDELDDAAFRQRLNRNVAILHELSAEIVSRAARREPALAMFMPAGEHQVDRYFEGLWRVLGTANVVRVRNPQQSLSQGFGSF